MIEETTLDVFNPKDACHVSLAQRRSSEGTDPQDAFTDTVI